MFMVLKAGKNSTPGVLLIPSGDAKLRRENAELNITAYEECARDWLDNHTATCKNKVLMPEQWV